MTHRLASCLAITLLALAAPRPAAADVFVQTVFDTVDSVEIRSHDICSGCPLQAFVLVRGIPAGGSVPSTQSFNFGNNTDMATRCEHLAVIAMSKPGKFQFGIGSDSTSTGGGNSGHGDCKLILVTP
jgi:hypothetical protein